MTIKKFFFSLIIICGALFYYSANTVQALTCPSGLTEQCAAPVTYTKNVVSDGYSQPNPLSQCFASSEVTGELEIRTDKYISHVNYNCREALGRFPDGDRPTVCDFTVTCEIAPVCTCASSVGGSCGTSVPFTNKNLEVYESTAGNYAVRYMFDLNSIVYGDIDIQTGAQEKYDIYKSDANGNPLETGNYISIFSVRNYIGDDQGNNIDSVVLIDKTTGVRNPATTIASKLRGTSLFSTADDMAYNALGEPDNKVTYMGDLKSRITVGFSNDGNCSPSPSPVAMGQCSMIKIYSTDWATEITPAAFKNLSAGTKVHFCVNGVTNTEAFDSARFTINGVTGAASSIVRPGSNDFCSLYAIPASTYSFKVQGEIHHKTLGWL